MRRKIDRTIDPLATGQIIRSRRMGSVTERDLVNEQRRLGRSGQESPLILTATLGPWFRENVPANTADVTFRLLALMTSSTNPASANALYNSTAGGGAAFVARQSLRVIGGFLHTPSTITAGSATLGVRIGASEIHYFSDGVLNATNTIGVLARISWRRGIVVPAGQSITPVVATSSGWLPTSADLQASLIVAWEDPD